MKKLITSSIVLATLLLIIIVSCKKKETTTTPPTPPCNYVQWTGTGNCNQSGYYAVSTISCCAAGFPFHNSVTGKCYETCEAAYRANNSGQITRYNDGASGGTTTGPGSCPSTNSFLSISSVFNNMCGNTNDCKVTYKNNSNQRLAVKVSIKKVDGTWQCGVGTPQPGETLSYYACKSTGQYNYKSMTYNDWLICGFGSSCP